MKNLVNDYIKSESRKMNIKMGFIFGGTLLLAIFAICVGFGIIELGANGIKFLF